VPILDPGLVSACSHVVTVGKDKGEMSKRVHARSYTIQHLNCYGVVRRRFRAFEGDNGTAQQERSRLKNRGSVGSRLPDNSVAAAGLIPDSVKRMSLTKPRPPCSVPAIPDFYQPTIVRVRLF
jgi:hypothetical protein